MAEFQQAGRLLAKTAGTAILRHASAPSPPQKIQLPEKNPEKNLAPAKKNVILHGCVQTKNKIKTNEHPDSQHMPAAGVALTNSKPEPHDIRS